MNKNNAFGVMLVAICCWKVDLAFQSDLIQEECQIKTRGFCLPKNYNKFQRPKPNESLEIQVYLHVEQITSVSDHDFTISMLMYNSFFWEDPALQYYGDGSEFQGNQDIALGIEWANLLWLPDLWVERMESVQQPKIWQEFAGKFHHYQSAIENK